MKSKLSKSFMPVEMEDMEAAVEAEDMEVADMEVVMAVVTEVVMEAVTEVEVRQ